MLDERPPQGPILPATADPQANLGTLVALVDESAEMEHHVSGEGLQLLWGYIWQVQPLQVKHILLVVSHLWECRGLYCRGCCARSWYS